MTRKNLSIKDYKEIRTPFVFFDETGSINDRANRYFCLGMIKCMQPFYLDSRIRDIREKHHFYDEIKWNAISKSKLNVLAQVVEAIFETKGIYFSSIVINKDNIDFAQAFNNNPYMAYERFTEILIKQSIEDNEILTVIADFVTTPKNIQFEIDVKHYLNEEMNRLAIGGIHRVDSKGVNLIQVTDLLIGAITYCYKLDLKLVKGDKNKVKVLNMILKKLNRTDFRGGMNARKFKVFEYPQI
jgi:predicted MPP superfamily phosphohydrolase